MPTLILQIVATVFACWLVFQVAGWWTLFSTCRPVLRAYAPLCVMALVILAAIWRAF